MHSAAVTFLACIAPLAQAQTVNVNVQAIWSTSLDNGLTWQTGAVTVPHTQSVVRARMMLAWDNPLNATQTRFVRARFDPVIVGAGPADTAAAFQGLQGGEWAGSWGSPLFANRYSGNDLKIDFGDTLPPGLGGLVSVNNGGITGFLIDGSPIRLFEYNLLLDGTAGTRTLGNVFGLLSTPVPPMTIFVGQTASMTTTYALSVQEAQVTVIPAPGSAALLASALAVVAHRRRRP